MAIPYEPIVKEDLNLGHGTVSVSMPGGGSATGNKVGIHTLLGAQFNVKDFGAVGDGVNDDGVAFQAALTALIPTGGILRVPDGVFKIDQRRLIYSSLKPLAILGDNQRAKIVWNPATDTPATDKGLVNISGTGSDDASHCSGVFIQGLSFDFGGARGDAYDTNKRGINIYNADDIHIERCYFQGCKAEMVGLGNFGSPTTPGNRAFVRFSTFYNFVQDGINPNVFDAIIVGNVMDTGDTPIEAGRDRVTIADNSFSNMNGNLKISSVLHFSVKGNRFRECAVTNQGGVTGVIHIVGGGATAPSKYGVVEGNTMVNTATHGNQAGIATARGTSTIDHDTIDIRGNTIVGIQNAIYPTSLLNSQITRNRIVGANVGIEVIDSTQVANNIIEDNLITGSVSLDIEDVSTDSRNTIVGWNTLSTGRRYGASGYRSLNGADTTPSVKRGIFFQLTANSGLTITNFDDALPGQEIEILFLNTNPTVQNNGNIVLSTGHDYIPIAAGESLRFRYDGTSWKEVSRSAQNRGPMSIGAQAAAVPVTRILTALSTLGGGPVNDGELLAFAVTCTGAQVGDVAYVSHEHIGANNWLISAFVSGIDTVRVVMMNKTGGSASIASGTMRVAVFGWT